MIARLIVDVGIRKCSGNAAGAQALSSPRWALVTRGRHHFDRNRAILFYGPKVKIWATFAVVVRANYSSVTAPSSTRAEVFQESGASASPASQLQRRRSLSAIREMGCASPMFLRATPSSRIGFEKKASHESELKHFAAAGETSWPATLYNSQSDFSA